MQDLRLISGYDVLYGKIKAFVKCQLFDQVVELDNPNTLRNLSELAATRTLIDTMKKAINALTVTGKGSATIRDYLQLRHTRPFMVKEQSYLIPKKSLYNKIIGDSHFELLFARFLDECNDIMAFTKNYLAVHFKLDYVRVNGEIANYYPDFIIKVQPSLIYFVETKGQQDLDVPLKMARLKQWCEDINQLQSEAQYHFVFVDEEGFNLYQPKSFQELIAGFKDYQYPH